MTPQVDPMMEAPQLNRLFEYKANCQGHSPLSAFLPPTMWGAVLAKEPSSNDEFNKLYLHFQKEIFETNNNNNNNNNISS